MEENSKQTRGGSSYFRSVYATYAMSLSLLLKYSIPNAQILFNSWLECKISSFHYHLDSWTNGRFMTIWRDIIPKSSETPCIVTWPLCDLHISYIILNICVPLDEIMKFPGNLPFDKSVHFHKHNQRETNILLLVQQ